MEADHNDFNENNSEMKDREEPLSDNNDSSLFERSQQTFSSNSGSQKPSPSPNQNYFTLH